MTFLRGSAEEILEVTSDSRHVYTDTEVDALIERLDRARAEWDAEAFGAALSGLAAAKTPAARRKLLALAADALLPMPDGKCAAHFITGLAECDLPGTAAAARSRVEAGKADARLWARLLAIHGNADDIEFLLGRGFDEEVAGSSNPTALALMLTLLDAGELSSQGLYYLTRFHPDEAFPWLQRQIREERAAGRRPARFDLYANAVTPSSLPEARQFLLSLADPEWRLAAATAVVRMAGRGLDTAGLEGLLDLPVTLLEEADGRTPVSTIYAAAGLVGGARALWTPRALAALTTAADRLGGGDLRDTLLKAAARVRVGMENPWR